MPTLLQLAQSYQNPESVNYRLAYLREQMEQQLLNLGDLAYADKVQLAMLGDTIQIGGYIRTELIDTRMLQIGDEDTNVFVSKDGIKVNNGNIVVKDAHNTAIITSNGLKVMYSFSSGGQYQGWQMVGICGVGSPYTASYEASIPVQIPEKLIIEKATLYAHCAPAYLTGYSDVEPDVPDGLYYPQNLALYVRDFDGTVFDYPKGSEPGVWYGSGGTEITNQVWGGRWSPTGAGVKTKIGNVTNYLTPGQQTVFVVQSVDSATFSNRMRFGIMKFDLVVEGFLRG